MRISLLPLIFMAFALPDWPIKTPSALKPHPKTLPQNAIELIPGIGSVQASRLKESEAWTQQNGIGPKTRSKLLNYLSP